jgi:hypothetical protein
MTKPYTKTAYGEKLKDPRWQKLRLEILERDEWACRSCGNTENTLHVHHTHYVQGLEPWDYVDEQQFLVTLCCDCHEEESSALSSAKQSLFASLSGIGIYLSSHIDFIANSLNHVPPMSTEEVKALADHLNGLMLDRLDTFVRNDTKESNKWVQVMNGREPF